MRLSTLAGNSFAVLLMSVVSAAGIAGATPNSEPVRLTGPLSHDNLAVYFVHGASKAGPVPLTLQEALAQGVGAGERDRQRQHAGDRESRRPGGVRAGRRRGEGRPAGSHLDGQPAAAAEIRPRPDRLVLRRARTLVGARRRGRAKLFGLGGGGALARDEAGDAGGDAGGRRPWRLRHRRAPAKGLGRRQGRASSGSPPRPGRTFVRRNRRAACNWRWKTKNWPTRARPMWPRSRRPARRATTSSAMCSPSTASSTARKSTNRTGCSARCGRSCWTPAPPRRSATATMPRTTMQDSAPPIKAVTAFLDAADCRQAERNAAQFRRAPGHARERQGRAVRNRPGRRLGAPELSGEVTVRDQVSRRPLVAAAARPSDSPACPTPGSCPRRHRQSRASRRSGWRGRCPC